MKFIFSISLLIISVILFFSIINPLRNDIATLRTDVDTYNVALSSSTDLQKTRDQLVDTYKNIKKEDRDRLDHFLPNTVNNIRFILEIERIANLHSMSIKNIKFDNVKGQDTKATVNTNMATPNNLATTTTYGTFPIDFTTDSNYDTFVLFLKDLEHNLRLVDIKSVGFAVPSPLDKTVGTDPNVYTYTIKVETYWLK